MSLAEQQQPIARLLCDALIEAGIKHTIIVNTEQHALITEPVVAGFVFMGSVDETISINRLLANRNGQIAQLISETDLEELPTLTDNYLLFRFITEKTQTINVTAVGGNATLLALGCGNQ